MESIVFQISMQKVKVLMTSQVCRARVSRITKTVTQLYFNNSLISKKYQFYKLEAGSHCRCTIFRTRCTKERVCLVLLSVCMEVSFVRDLFAQEFVQEFAQEFDVHVVLLVSGHI